MYETAYKGYTSNIIPVITVVGQPRSGRTPTIGYTCKKGLIEPRNQDDANMTIAEFLHREKVRIADVEKWKRQIAKQMHHELDALFQKDVYFPCIPSEAKGFTACNLYVTFNLLNSNMGEASNPYFPYKDLDLDNLLKPVLDALKMTNIHSGYPGLITDDRYIRGIKARKEPVKGKPGVEIKCVPNKAFKILHVERGADKKGIPGAEFKPYWLNPVQYIAAEDQDGNIGYFLDNMPGNIFIDGQETKYDEAVPGYKWLQGHTHDDCIVTARKHFNADWENDPRNAEKQPDKEDTFYWLQKWEW